MILDTLDSGLAATLVSCVTLVSFDDAIFDTTIEAAGLQQWKGKLLKEVYAMAAERERKQHRRWKAMARNAMLN